MAFCQVLRWAFSLWSHMWAQQPSTSLLYVCLRFDTMNYVQEMAPFLLTRPSKYPWEDICPWGAIFPSLYIHPKPLMSWNWRTRGSWTVLSMICLRFRVHQGHTYFLLPGPWQLGSSLAGSLWWKRNLCDPGLSSLQSPFLGGWFLRVAPGPAAPMAPVLGLELFLNLLS